MRGYIKTIIITMLAVILCQTGYAQTSKSVTMKVGDVKTLHLPTSVTSKYLQSTRFYAVSPEYADVKSYTLTSVTVVVNKALSAPVIIRCDYTYLVLRNGRYVYGGTGFFDFKVTVQDIPVTSISLPAEKTIYVGERETLDPSITPSNATSKLEWSSSVYSTINIDKNTGSMLAQRTGTSIITVTSSNGKSASCTVTAIRRSVDVTGVSVSPSSYTINEGESYSLKATVTPSNATDKSITWTSDNPTVVSVSSTGTITGKAAGTAYITARSSNGKSARCFVTCRSVIKDITLSDKDGISSVPSKANITYERTFEAGWNSICVPFTITQSMLDSFGEGYYMAQYDDKEILGDKRAVSLRRTDSLVAGTPGFIYSPDTKRCTFLLNNVALVESPSASGCARGAFISVKIGSGMYKLSDDGQSFGITMTDEATCAPFRAYISTIEQ